MSVYVFENEAFQALARFLVVFTRDPEIRALGEHKIAHTLRDANVQSMLERYNENDFEEKAEFSPADAPDSTEAFFLAKGVMIQSLEWSGFLKSKAYSYLCQIMRLAMHPASEGGSTYLVGHEDDNASIGMPVYNKSPFGGEGYIYDIKQEPPSYLLGAGRLSGVIYKVIKLDTANNQFTQTQWHAEQCVSDLSFMPSISVETVQGIARQLEQNQLAETKCR